MYTIKTHSLSKEEIQCVAEIHTNHIKLGFLSQLGSGFLYYLYKSMNVRAETELLIAKTDDEVVGFITGATSLKPVLFHLIRHYFVQSIYFVITKLLSSISNIKKKGAIRGRHC